jgi:hypothetical protein
MLPSLQNKEINSPVHDAKFDETLVPSAAACWNRKVPRHTHIWTSVA